MTAPLPPLPPLPTPLPAHGRVLLREFTDDDVPMVVDLCTDPYVPHIGSLPPFATPEQALAWIRGQGAWAANGLGYSFAIADVESGVALGTIGLRLRQAEGRATSGYTVAPAHRGRGVAGDALTALARFAWSVSGVPRIELSIEPWNTASIRTAEVAGFRSEGLVPKHREVGGELRDMLRYVAERP